VVSTAVLPTSGQANPTFTAVQLGLRLAARLAAAPEAGVRARMTGQALDQENISEEVAP
jgi:choline dehydrogenase-like flavoprotein